MAKRNRRRTRSGNRRALAAQPQQRSVIPDRRRLGLFATAATAVIAAVVGLALLWSYPTRQQGVTVASASQPTYVGGQACSSCHQAQTQLWQESHHALAMQPADSKTVLGNFNNTTFSKDGVTTVFYTRGETYWVRTDGPDGELHDYKIAYTFGVEPLQQYLIELSNGRYQALSIAWDTRPAETGGQRWFHLYPQEHLTAKDELHWTGPQQNWNFMCAECHSTNLQKNYRPKDDRFETTWSDINVSCEACHGPGSRHLEWAHQAQRGGVNSDPLRGLVFTLKDTSSGSWVLASGDTISRRTQPLSSRAEVETCGRCHSRRAQIWSDYRHGQPLAQTHHVVLLDQGLYHADGQILDEVYEYGSFLQSRMYQAGVTCTNCHDPHSARLRRTGNVLCAQCHLPDKYDQPQHHFHKTGTEAAQCVSCHMAQRFYMVVDGRRDHSFRVPRPDLSIKLGTPNACNDCHNDRSAQWAAEAVDKWYGPSGKRGWHYGVAIRAGRDSQADAEKQLVQTIEDATLPAIVRATALSLLPRSAELGSLRAVTNALRDSDPLVRRAAVAALSIVGPQERAALGFPLLNDPVRTVRLEALSGLLDARRDSFTSTQLATLDQVIAEYREAQVFNADRAEANVSLGALDARLGSLEAAEAAYHTAIRLQPSFSPAYINLAVLYCQQGQEEKDAQSLH